MSRTPRPDPLGDVASFASLGDERRRRLYDYVVAQRRPIGRDEAAEAVGIGRPLAAYHLDKLADAGRPAKQYLRPERALKAETSARDYEFVAQLLAETVDRAGADLGHTARRLAREHGRQVGAELASATSLEAELAARGYEPRRDPDRTLRLANCPFHALATNHPELVCGLNHAFLEGLLAGADAAELAAELEPRDSHCCVAIHRRDSLP